MAAVDIELLNELGELIEDLTTTGKSILDENLMKKVKKICKASDSYVDHTYHQVMTQLNKQHAEIRLSSFQIISELFTRSHKFRELLLDDFQMFLELAVGISVDDPLPPPSYAAKTLKEKAVNAIDSWQQKYGAHYKKLDLGYNYLKRIKHVHFDAIRSRSVAEQHRLDERERRQQGVLMKKLGNVEVEIAEQTGEMELCITEMNNCFKLLLPHPEDYQVHCDLPDDSNIAVPSVKPKGVNSKYNPENISTGNEGITGNAKNNGSSKSDDSKTQTNSTKNDEDEGCESFGDDRDVHDDAEDAEGNTDDFITHHGLGSRSYHIDIELSKMKPTVHETEDNTIILDTLRDMNKEICHKHLPMIHKWLKVFTKAGQPQSRIQSIIDLKRELEKVRDKFQELDIDPSKKQLSEAGNLTSKNIDEESDDEFEEVPEKEGVEYIPDHKRAEYGLEPLVPATKSSPGSSKSGKSSPNISIASQDEEEAFLKASGFTLKDAEDPTSLARSLLESRRRHLDSLPSTSGGIREIRGTKITSTSTNDTSLQYNEKKKKLLNVAPVVPYDRDLYYWENPDIDVPRRIKSENFNNNWAYKDVDVEVVLENEKGGMLKRAMTFAGKFEPVKWSCRAPLPNGKLCPRKDRINCPFHGKIIARDEHGNPAEVSGISASTSSVNSTSTPGTSQDDWREIQPEIEAATGLDLGGKWKKRKARKKDDDNKEMSRKKKYARLTNLKKTSTARSRLEGKVLSRAAVKRVTEEMDSLATKKVMDKFGDQFNYSLH